MINVNNVVKRRQALLFAGGAAVILAVLFYASRVVKQNRPAAVEAPITIPMTPPGSVEDSEAWRAVEGARRYESEKELQNLSGEVGQQRILSERIRLELEQIKAATDLLAKEASESHTSPVVQNQAPNGPLDPSRFRGLPSVPEMPEVPGTSVGIVPHNLASGAVNKAREHVPALPRMEVIRFSNPGALREDPLPVAGFEPSPKPTRMTFIPASTFVKVLMLNGVDASTGGQVQSDPLPMAFHVLELANLPSHYQLDIKDCRFIGAVWGELSSERMRGRIESLSCVIDGVPVYMEAKGSINGEDSKVGVRGRLITKQGPLLANALFSGALSGIGNAIQQSTSILSLGAGGATQIIDPQRVGRSAIGGGTNSAANMLAQYYLKAADKIYPTIETDGAREVEILITHPVIYEGTAIGEANFLRLLRRNGLPVQEYDDD